MFLKIYFKECKSILKSILYLIFIGLTILFYVSQLGDYAGQDIKQYNNPNIEMYGNPILSNPLIKPQENSESYGTKESEIPEQVIPAVIEMLESEFEYNAYTTYPIGFYKNVRLNASEQKQIEQILESVKRLNDYEKFKEYMFQADKILGGGSSYAPSNFKQYGQIPVTYEEKLSEYNAFISEDKITGAYARLFCDYMGIVVALFSVFVPVSFSMRDKKAHINELIYSRKINSPKIIISRYLALVTMTVLPFVLLSFIPTTQIAIFGMHIGILVDMFAFFKYIVGWLLPSILITTAVGIFLTILTDTPIGIAVQFLYSFLGVLVSISNIKGGNYGFELAIRHNTLGNLQGYKDGINQLIMNRISYVIVALILVIATIIIYELKRKGSINIGASLQKIFSNIKGANKTNNTN